MSKTGHFPFQIFFMQKKPKNKQVWLDADIRIEKIISAMI